MAKSKKQAHPTSSNAAIIGQSYISLKSFGKKLQLSVAPFPNGKKANGRKPCWPAITPSETLLDKPFTNKFHVPSIFSQQNFLLSLMDDTILETLL